MHVTIIHFQLHSLGESCVWWSVCSVVTDIVSVNVPYVRRLTLLFSMAVDIHAASSHHQYGHDLSSVFVIFSVWWIQWKYLGTLRLFPAESVKVLFVQWLTTCGVNYSISSCLVRYPTSRLMCCVWGVQCPVDYITVLLHALTGPN